MSRFSERLRALRLERGLTQLQLAGKAGITPTTVSRLEIDYRQGTRPGDVSVGTLDKLARALDVPVSVLLGEDADAEPVQS